jgi:hypothetical protein
MIRTISLLMLFACVVPNAKAFDERDIVVAPRAGYFVRVDVDKADRIYREGDLLTATVKSQKEGYLYLINITKDGRTNVIFPNKFRQDNKIKADEVIQVPGKKDEFDFPIQGPKFGEEYLLAVVTPKPIPELTKDKDVQDALAKENLTRSIATAIEQSR